MLIDIVKKGSTDRSVLLRIIDSADGTPETGVVFNTSGIDLWYRREGAAKTSLTEATLAALTTAHADGGFLHVGDGYYRLDLPDAAFATAANYVDVGGTVTGMVVIGGRVRLVDIDIEVAAIPANMTQISGDTTAADNLEKYTDGTEFMPVDAHKPNFDVTGTTLTVKHPDGTTTNYTKTVTTDAGAEPITGAS